MHGGGNDFVLIDHRDRFIPEAEQPQFARRVCHRQLGVGADGLILIEASPTAAATSAGAFITPTAPSPRCAATAAAAPPGSRC